MGSRMRYSKFRYLEPVRVISKEGDLSKIYNQNAKVIDITIEGYSEWHYTIQLEGNHRCVVAESALESVDEVKKI